jgi:REP element-mobilizing transposase RayT
VDWREIKMPRTARIKSSTGTYHIIMRGINRHTIFFDDEDNQRFLSTLNEYKETCGYRIFAYCLMGNHLHLVIKVEQETLEQILRRLCGSFVYWYNKKYDRIGNLFQDRFRSEPIENDRSLLAVIRYIHQNPIKAGVAKDISEYNWSSYREYIGISHLADIDFILEMLDSNRSKSIEQFKTFNHETNKDEFLEGERKKLITDNEAMKIINKECGNNGLSVMYDSSIIICNRILKKLKDEGLSVRQIARLTGLNRGVIHNA